MNIAYSRKAIHADTYLRETGPMLAVFYVRNSPVRKSETRYGLMRLTRKRRVPESEPEQGNRVHGLTSLNRIVFSSFLSGESLEYKTLNISANIGQFSLK